MQGTGNLVFGIPEIFARCIRKPGNQANYWNLGSTNHIVESSIQDYMDFLTRSEIV